MLDANSEGLWAQRFVTGMYRGPMLFDEVSATATGFEDIFLLNVGP